MTFSKTCHFENHFFEPNDSFLLNYDGKSHFKMYLKFNSHQLSWNFLIFKPKIFFSTIFFNFFNDIYIGKSIFSQNKSDFTFKVNNILEYFGQNFIYFDENIFVIYLRDYYFFENFLENNLNFHVYFLWFEKLILVGDFEVLKKIIEQKSELFWQKFHKKFSKMDPFWNLWLL